MKKCEICGSSFEPKSQNQRFCKPDCIRAGRLLAQNKRRNKIYENDVCQGCGCPLTENDDRFCSSECQLKWLGTIRPRVFEVHNEKGTIDTVLPRLLGVPDYLVMAHFSNLQNLGVVS